MDALSLVGLSGGVALALAAAWAEFQGERARTRREREIRDAFDRPNAPLREGAVRLLGKVGERVDAEESAVGEPLVTVKIVQTGERRRRRRTDVMEWSERRRTTESVAFYLDLADAPEGSISASKASGSSSAPDPARARVIVDAQHVVLRSSLTIHARKKKSRLAVATLVKGEEVSIAGVLEPSESTQEVSHYRAPARMLQLVGSPATPLIMTTRTAAHAVSRTLTEVLTLVVRVLAVAAIAIALSSELAAGIDFERGFSHTARALLLGADLILIATLLSGVYWLPDGHLPWYERHRVDAIEPTASTSDRILSD